MRRIAQRVLTPPLTAAAAWLVWAGAGSVGCGATSPTVPGPGEAALGMNAGLPTSDAITEVVVERRPWRFAGYEGQIIVTPHYRLHTTLSRHTVIDRLPLFLERALAHYASALARLPEPGSRLDTYLFGTRNQWEAKTREMLPDQAAVFLTLGRGGFTTRGTSVLYYIGRSDTLAIAAHEGWHQFSQRTFRNQLPLWLEEGIATYMEGYISYPDGLPKFRPWANLERYHTLRDAVRADRLIPLETLLSRAPQSFLESGKSRLLVYYAQVWALTHFLAGGEDGRYHDDLQELLIDAAQGRMTSRSLTAMQRRGSAASVRLGPIVLTAYFDRDLDGFERRYLQFVHDLVRTGGRDRIVRGQSPLAE